VPFFEESASILTHPLESAGRSPSLGDADSHTNHEDDETTTLAALVA
jgi:hypothetical protein